MLENKKISVLQDWVMSLPLREQGTLMTCARGCDSEPKTWTKTGVAYSPGRRLTSFIRWCFMNQADPREVNDQEEGGFMMTKPPDPFNPSDFAHLPQHWYSHAMHSLEIIGYRHPQKPIAIIAEYLYLKMVQNMHLNHETKIEMVGRLSEDRMINKTVCVMKPQKKDYPEGLVHISGTEKLIVPNATYVDLLEKHCEELESIIALNFRLNMPEPTLPSSKRHAYDGQMEHFDNQMKWFDKAKEVESVYRRK